MYKSLQKNCKNFTLYIFSLCNESYDILKTLNLENVKLISLEELEQAMPDLLRIKSSRTKGEYCWTCSSATILYCLQNFDIEECTYIDADCYFFDNPKYLIEEMNSKSILLTEHRYTPCYNQTEKSGKYCVQFMTFRNNEKSLKALNWWYNKCIEWCFNKYEDNKFGDQKYLDDWTERFEDIHILNHLGGGVAPWNVQQYSIYKYNKKLYVKNSEQNVPIVFYHFHDIKIIDGNIQENILYQKNKNVKNLIYKTYLNNLVELSKLLNQKDKQIKIIRFQKKSIFKQLNEFRRNIIKIKFGKDGYISIFNRKLKNRGGKLLIF